MKIVFASNNQHKITELQAVMPAHIGLITLKEAGITIDIPEPHETLEDNAREKARTIYGITNQPCFSEDTGLEVNALDGEPGVHSARYAGDEKSFSRNIEKLLARMQNVTDRRAQFRAVMCLVLRGEEHFFEGVCKGRIIETLRGNQGFGYDPVFVPDGSDRTFAEMTVNEKNNFNHRRKAADKLVAFLNKLHSNR